MSLSRCQKTVHTLSVLALPYQVQDLRIHYLFECWPILDLFYAARLLNISMAMRTQHSSRKVNRRHSTNKVDHMANHTLRCDHCKLNLPPPLRPRHLLSIPILPCQVQSAGSHAPFHCGPVSFFFSAVRLPRMQMGTHTAASGRLSHICIWFLCNYCNLFVHAECVHLISHISQH